MMICEGEGKKGGKYRGGSRGIRLSKALKYVGIDTIFERMMTIGCECFNKLRFLGRIADCGSSASS